MPLYVETPCFESRALSVATGRSIRLKWEALQPSGSFKLRGIALACEDAVRRGARRLVASSGGNAGVAVAYCGRRLGVPVSVVVPENATERAQARIRLEGAEVVVHGASWLEANARAEAMMGEKDAFLHPFDDPLLWQGHATMIDEVARRGPRPDVVVLSVGGGGLLCGVVEGLRRQGWADVPILAVETAGAESLHRSLRAGERVELAEITSVAASLGAKRVCENAYRLAREHPVQSVVVSDLEAVEACERFLDDHQLVVEPACGAALALPYGRPAELARFATVLVIVCGGVTATVDDLRAWSRQLRFEASGE